MIDPASPWCQRWQDRRSSWRHVSEGGFDRRRYDVVELLDDTTPRAYVERHHYSGTYPAAARRYGLFQAAELVGVAVLSVPVQAKVLTAVFPELEPYRESLELGRFVLADEVPANAESWFLARVFDLAAAAGVAGVVSFSDPLPRTSVDGGLVFKGHIGTIYQATNAAYLGRGTARSLMLLPNGLVLNARAVQKVRSGERGTDYVEQLLCRYGAPPRAGRPGPAWLPEALAAAHVRSVRHPGNHRYAFRLGPRRKRITVGLPSGPYPKMRLDNVEAAA